MLLCSYKVDPSNAPHVGGNTWAGGTGGRDTAGLGGKGGPYRLDAGHDVFQVSDAEKDAVPNEVRTITAICKYCTLFTTTFIRLKKLPEKWDRRLLKQSKHIA